MQQWRAQATHRPLVLILVNSIWHGLNVPVEHVYISSGSEMNKKHDSWFPSRTELNYDESHVDA